MAPVWSLVAQEKSGGGGGGAGMGMGGFDESECSAFEPGCYGFEL